MLNKFILFFTLITLTLSTSTDPFTFDQTTQTLIIHTTNITQNILPKNTKIAKFAEKIKNLPDNFFINFNQLTTVIFPSSLLSIGNNTFYNCTSLNTIYYFGNNKVECAENSFGKIDKIDVYVNSSQITQFCKFDILQITQKCTTSQFFEINKFECVEKCNSTLHQRFNNKTHNCECVENFTQIQNPNYNYSIFIFYITFKTNKSADTTDFYFSI